MHLHEVGVTGRLKTRLPFESKRPANTQMCASPLLAQHELRRLVADMVD